ncbi:MAG: cupin [Phycisphaerae bacterium]|nr:cupin [Phycisphaerae bacterium]|tara:strand:+ start:455 stop:823 length:369 start_codon:yes stop_codon:yes gene_type:complete
MLIRKTDPATTTPVDMAGVKDTSMQIMVGRDDGAPNFAMRHFVVQPGGHTPHHQHDYEHEVYIVEGRAEAECDGETAAVVAGDVLYVPANAMHQFRNDSDAPMRFLCLVPVTYDCDKPVPGS